MSFIDTHADFITFLYGLAFVILASISLVQKLLGNTTISWRWLAVFAFLHGAYEWLEVLKHSLPDAPAALGTTARVLALGSFLALLEFARVNWFAIRPTPRMPSRILLALMAGGILLALAQQTLALRVATGAAALVAGLWAGATLIRVSRHADTVGQNWLRMGGIVLAAFGVSESLVKLLVVSGLAEQLTGLAITGNTNLLRTVDAVFAVLLTVAVWIYIQHLHPQTTQENEMGPPKHHQRYTLWLFASLLIVLAAGWYATDLLGQKARESVRGRSHGATEILAAHLRDEMSRTDLMAELLSKSPAVLPAVKGTSPESLAAAESMLRQYTAVLETSSAFLLTPDGTIVASSDPAAPSGRPGESFGFLPYFQDSSVYGLAGKDLAVEPTPGQRGYYVSYPVQDAQGDVQGIAVVKKTLAQTDKEFKRYRDWFLVSPQGIVFLSSRPELVLEPLWPISDSERQQIIATGQFGSGPFANPLLEQAPADGQTVHWESSQALANVISVRSDGWRAVIVENLDAVAVQRLYGIGATLFVAMFIICFFVVVQREAAFEMRLAEDQRRLKQLNEALELQATTDALTGAFNRMKFDAMLLAEVDRARRYGSRFALVMFDIDHFKRINDTYGHQTGDRVLETVSRLTRETIRCSDSFARWGGEEFMVLLPMTPLDGTISLTERIRQALARFAFDPVPEVTCSFGVTEYAPGDTSDSIVKRADEALYWAKTAGRNRIELNLVTPPQ